MTHWQMVRPGTRNGSRPEALVHSALTGVLRWASRPDVQRRLLGPAGADLSPTDTWLLSAIDERGPVRSSDLASWQGVDKSTITPQVRRLETRGLITRQPDAQDRRAALLTITPAGRDIRRRMAAAGSSVIDQLLQDWSQADRATFAALITRFTEQLEHTRPAEP